MLVTFIGQPYKCATLCNNWYVFIYIWNCKYTILFTLYENYEKTCVWNSPWLGEYFIFVRNHIYSQICTRINRK